MPLPRDDLAPGSPEEVPVPREPRTYVITGGRAQVEGRYVLRMETQVAPGSTVADASVEVAQVLDACQGRSISVAEVAEILRRPVWAAKILIADALAAGALLLPRPASHAPGSDADTLRRVLAGLNAW